MRIDKYLWTVRYYKTRNQASDACKKGHVSINDQKVKPSRDVFVGDKIVMRKNQIDHRIEILDIPKSRVGAKIVDLYRKDTTPPEVFEHIELMRHSRSFYRKKGEGRPTKKDRRDIEDFNEDV